MVFLSSQHMWSMKGFCLAISFFLHFLTRGKYSNKPIYSRVKSVMFDASLVT